MKKLSKPFLIILVCTVAVFIFCLVFAFCRKIPSDVVLLEKDVFSYRIQDALILFCKLIFSTFATGIAIGFSWAFATEADPKRHRNSAFMLPQLKNVLIVVTFCTLLFVVASNLIQPLAETKQKNMLQDAVNFSDYTTLAKEHASRHEYVSAQFYASTAYALNPDDPDAKEFAREMDLQVVSQNDYVENVAEELEESLTYLQMAQKAWDENDFWNAHYYAVLAEQTSPRDDETLKIARELASRSWNKLGTYTEGVSQDTEQIYSAKKEAYDYLEKGDTLQAYYAFRMLSELLPSDLDVQKYFQAAKNQLEAMYFYTDETTDMRALENYHNISFSLQTEDGGTEKWNIKGITVVGNTGQLVQYLRDVLIAKITSDGTIVSILNVPYAKMSAQSITLDKKVQYQPFLLFESVNKNADIEKLHIKPEWIIDDGSPIPSYRLIDMSYDDFTLVRQASQGPELMPLISLFKFASKADTYGFSSASYLTTLILRLSLPLFVLAMFLYMAVIGWGLRLAPDQPFKTRWLLMFPLLAFVTYIAKDLVLYILKLLVFVLCDYVPELALVIIVATAILTVFLTCIYFLSQRSE